MKDIQHLFHEKLRKQVSSLEKKRKTLRKKMDLAFERGWKYKEEVSNVEAELRRLRIELGRRKGSGCPALKVLKGAVYPEYICQARDLHWMYITRQDEMFNRLCSKCRWSREQIMSRMLVMKIRGK